jgi:hypothetical protein
MREIRLYGSEGGGAARSPYPYQVHFRLLNSVELAPTAAWIPAFAGMTQQQKRLCNRKSGSEESSFLFVGAITTR